MAQERLDLHVSKPDVRIGEGPDGPVYKHLIQYLSLVDLEQNVVANTELYLDPGYYSIHWDTKATPAELTQLIEACVTSFEARPEGSLKDVSGQPIDTGEKIEPFSEETVYKEGLLIYVKGDEDARKVLPLPRPLSWEGISQGLEEQNITFVRINTWFGDFFMYLTREVDERHNFGLLSHLKDVEEFAVLMQRSTVGSISPDEAHKLIGAIPQAFEKASDQREKITSLQGRVKRLTEEVVAQMNVAYPNTGEYKGTVMRIDSNEQDGGSEALLLGTDGEWSGKFDMSGYSIGKDPGIDDLLHEYASIKDPNYQAIAAEEWQTVDGLTQQEDPEIAKKLHDIAFNPLSRSEEEQEFWDQNAGKTTDVHETCDRRREEFIRDPENRIRLLEGLVGNMEEVLTNLQKS